MFIWVTELILNVNNYDLKEASTSVFISFFRQIMQAYSFSEIIHTSSSLVFIALLFSSLRIINTGLVSSRVSLTSWREGDS